MTVPSSARFFLVSGLHPPHTLLILGLIVATGVWTTVWSPPELDSALAMVLFIQMFLASTGFLVPARRGHFDPLLVARSRRTGPMVWHWFVSVAPGVVAWLALAGVGYLAGSPVAQSAVIGGRAAALAIVSLVAWPAGVTLQRGGAGVVWVAILLALLMSRVDLLAPPSTHLFAGAGWTVLRHALTLLVCPFLLIGRHPAIGPAPVCAAVLFAALAILAVLRRAERLDLYLVDRT
jgi:hypothetical protein